MKVAVVYHMFPHYRLAVMAGLDRSERNEFTFYGDDREFEGVKPLRSTSLQRFVNAPFAVWKGLYWQRASIAAALSPRFDAIIFLANPNFVSTWIAAVLARILRKRVLFWTHGWLKSEARSKAWIRSIFYRLADKVLVYSERAKRLGAASGFPDDRIAVIYNSLDGDVAAPIYEALEKGSPTAIGPQSLFNHNERPLLICTARITPLCRFDLLFDAAERLGQRGRPVNILLVGDGPSRPSLEKVASEKGLDVVFFGPCYDEAILGALIYGSDLTVSPGKVGLTAMHSLMYGTAVVTHSDLDAQMPEVEAIVEGRTGAFFLRDDVDDLAKVIENWLNLNQDRSLVRQACRQVIADKWNSVTQVKLIEAALGDRAA